MSGPARLSSNSCCSTLPIPFTQLLQRRYLLDLPIWNLFILLSMNTVSTAPHRRDSNLIHGISVATLSRSTARVGAEIYQQNTPTSGDESSTSVTRCPTELFRARSFWFEQQQLIDSLREKLERYHRDVKTENRRHKPRSGRPIYLILLE